MTMPSRRKALFSEVKALVCCQRELVQIGLEQPWIRSQRRLETRYLNAFRQRIQIRQARRQSPVDAHRVCHRSAERPRVCPIRPGRDVGEHEGPLCDRRDAREPPLLELRGRKSEAFESGNRAFARLYHPARLRRSLLQRAAELGQVVFNLRAYGFFTFDELCHVFLRYISWGSASIQP